VNILGKRDIQALIKRVGLDKAKEKVKDILLEVGI